MQGCTIEWMTKFQREAITRYSKRGQSGNTVIWDPESFVHPLSKFLDPSLHTSYVRTVKALARLCRCAGSPETSLVAYVIGTTISWVVQIQRLLRPVKWKHYTNGWLYERAHSHKVFWVHLPICSRYVSFIPFPDCCRCIVKKNKTKKKKKKQKKKTKQKKKKKKQKKKKKTLNWKSRECHNRNPQPIPDTKRKSKKKKKKKVMHAR